MAEPWESLAASAVTENDQDSIGGGLCIRIAGTGLRNYLPSEAANCEVVSHELWEPRSIEVGQIGWEKFLRGEFSSATSLAANYIRHSAAEEKKRVGDNS